MWPPGHVAVAYILYWISRRRQRAGDVVVPPSVGSLFALFVGAVGPDLVDKPLSWYLGILPTGRSLAHSLVTIVPVAVVVLLVARRYDRGNWGIAFVIGAISHVFLDAVSVLWDPESSATFLLWPILPVEPYPEGPPTILGLLSESITDPYFLTEFAFLAIALFLWRRDGYPGLELLSRR